MFIAKFPFISGNIDTMVITKGPFPIDSVAKNWPSTVKSSGIGSNLDIVVNAYM